MIDKPIVMGIINITPDSFFAGSRRQGMDDIVMTAGKMLSEGATILDIGGQSTRPGSEKLGVSEELDRVIPAITAIRQKFPGCIISVDSFYSKVAEEAVAAGASMINDISGGEMDKDMIPTVGRLNVPYVLMHMQGTSQTMQQDPRYENVTKEVLDFFIGKKAELDRAGVKDIIYDPGFGFGKKPEHNFELLHNLEVFSMLQGPLLVGVSRKSMITKPLGIKTDEALNGTTVLNTIGLMNTASVLRVHDVREAAEAIELYWLTRSSAK